jgi:hypothetical protein
MGPLQGGAKEEGRSRGGWSAGGGRWTTEVGRVHLGSEQQAERRRGRTRKSAKGHGEEDGIG